MTYLRSFLFALFLILIAPIYGLCALLVMPFPLDVRHRFMIAWAPIILSVARVLLGIRFRVIGRENLPQGMAVILSKHQSAWETMAFHMIFPPVSFVLKRELLWVPFMGWGFAQIAHIAINRKSAKNALNQLAEQGCANLKAGYWVAIFPEGTRVVLGEEGEYRAGGAMLAKRAGVPIVPVAHNAGEFWPKNAFVKRPGEIIVSIGPPIDVAGKKASALNAEAQAWIEGEMRRLFPHHYAAATAVTEAAAQPPDGA